MLARVMASTVHTILFTIPIRLIAMRLSNRGTMKALLVRLMACTLHSILFSIAIVLIIKRVTGIPLIVIRFTEDEGLGIQV
jgi:hypothetical protein